jgi:hypothetical protein
VHYLTTNTYFLNKLTLMSRATLTSYETRMHRYNGTYWIHLFMFVTFITIAKITWHFGSSNIIPFYPNKVLLHDTEIPLCLWNVCAGKRENVNHKLWNAQLISKGAFLAVMLVTHQSYSPHVIFTCSDKCYFLSLPEFTPLYQLSLWLLYGTVSTIIST